MKKWTVLSVLLGFKDEVLLTKVMVGYVSFSVVFLLPSDAVNVRGMVTLLVSVRESRDVEDAEGNTLV